MNEILGWAGLAIPTLALATTWERRVLAAHKRQKLINHAITFLAIGQFLSQENITSITENTLRAISGLWELGQLLSHTSYMLAITFMLAYALDSRKQLNEYAQRIAAGLAATLLMMWCSFFIGGMGLTNKDDIYGKTIASYSYMAILSTAALAMLTVASFNIFQASRVVTKKQGRCTCLLYTLGSVSILVATLTNTAMQLLPDNLLGWHPSIVLEVAFQTIGASFTLGAHLTYRRMARPLTIPDCWPPAEMKIPAPE